LYGEYERPKPLLSVVEEELLEDADVSTGGALVGETGAASTGAPVVAGSATATGVVDVLLATSTWTFTTGVEGVGFSAGAATGVVEEVELKEEELEEEAGAGVYEGTKVVGWLVPHAVWVTSINSVEVENGFPF
jgi:hypothetical protein